MGTLETFDYNPLNGEIYWHGKPEGIPDDEYATIKLSTENLKSFPKSVIGEPAFWNEEFRCWENHEETFEYYIIVDSKFKQRTWKDRYESGEFELEDFREKVFKSNKRDYTAFCQYNDNELNKYLKRKELEILEEDDEVKYTESMNEYKERTLLYRERKEAIKTSDFDELLSIWKNIYGAIE